MLTKSIRRLKQEEMKFCMMWKCKEFCFGVCTINKCKMKRNQKTEADKQAENRRKQFKVIEGGLK